MSKIEWHTETRAIGDLKAHPKNPRAFTKKGISDLEKSIGKFGLAEPLVINVDGLVIGGHARWRVLKQQGAKECACYVPSRKLTMKECDELNIRLNANIAGEWDFDILANEWEPEDLTEWGVDAPKRLDAAEMHDVEIRKLYEVVIECADEREQELTYNRIIELGYKCRILSI